MVKSQTVKWLSIIGTGLAIGAVIVKASNKGKCPACDSVLSAVALARAVCPTCFVKLPRVT